MFCEPQRDTDRFSRVFALEYCFWFVFEACKECAVLLCDEEILLFVNQLYSVCRVVHFVLGVSLLGVLSRCGCLKVYALGVHENSRLGARL